ncbi:MAG: 1,4-alpha-glucan branching protein GlgB [Ruminococcaceae bacterium]|nr:1,4-alpha-glucan branching protein GlgB [Oscillospiraceae bacterium]
MDEKNLAPYFFHQGTNFYAYKYLGCNLMREDNGYVYTFRTWAPHAERVELISDIYGWQSPYPMMRVTDGGIWECTVKSATSLDGYAYKFRITSAGRIFDKGDPYALYSRGMADGASVIYCDGGFEWCDSDWLRRRRKTVSEKGGRYLSAPLNIYEVHMGSFMRHDDNEYYTYREIADVLAPYLKFMGYTHVEFLPLAEHPFDGSWGYQVCGFYAPTSRYGTPDDFRYLVDKLHQNGIGVIMDWVPAHFPKDAWGLYEFDGAPLYEYQGEDRKESRSWGTRFFDVGREEIQSFLISNALYFFREFHIDGLRVDAVASMLYLDYDKDPGEWVPNSKGTNINLEGEAFFRKLNSAVFGEFPDVLMIAEESAAHGGITHPVYENGLGFNLKWNMGWANDFYDYVMTDPLFRKHKHTALNFPLMYAYTENYILPISHDEVVHGKLSFIDKMHGSYEDKFLQARTALMLMMTYPGKKMLFMGTEYGQFREWDYENSLEWFMLDYPKHRQLREYVAELNRFYLRRSELWDLDFSPEGFEWLLADEAEKNIVAFRRRDSKGASVIVILSFSGCDQEITIPLKQPSLTKLFDTGSYGDIREISSITGKRGGYTARIRVPRFSGIILSDKKIYKKH